MRLVGLSVLLELCEHEGVRARLQLALELLLEEHLVLQEPIAKPLVLLC